MHRLEVQRGDDAGSVLADWAGSACRLMTHMQMRGPCKWIWSHLNMHHSSLEMHTISSVLRIVFVLLLHQSVFTEVLLRLINRKAGGQRVWRRPSDTYMSVNKPKQLRVKKECFREWFQQILAPWVEYHRVLREPSQGSVHMWGDIEWSSKNQMSRNIYIFQPTWQ